MFNGLAVLIHVAQGRGYVVVALCQQAAVGGQVLELQGQALLEVFQCLWVVTWGGTGRASQAVYMWGASEVQDVDVITCA